MTGSGFEHKNGFNAKPLGFQRITNVSAAVGLTMPSAGKAHGAVIRAVTQDVRWRDDGTDPTAAVGMLLRTTDPPLEYNGNLEAIKFIEVTASAELEVSYYNVDG